MNEAPVIQAENVSIRYGRRHVLDAVSFAVPHGAVYAMLGRNGAGKSSLVRALLGAQRPHEGHAAVFGRKVWDERVAVMARVGFVPEEAEAEKEMSVGQLVDFQRRLFPRWDDRIVARRLDRLGIARNRRFQTLSKGEGRQVLFTLALATLPDLLILDDPTLGLDAVSRKEFYDEFVGELAERRTTTFITTHDLAGVEGIADRVGILGDGKLLLDEDLESLKARYRKIRRPAEAAATGNLAHSTRWGEWVEQVVSDYEPGTAVDGDVAPMSLEEIFIAAVGQEEGR
ncbi:MAG TPA: ABC transporter ATP-binding protein [Thermoanaerobaculia bacterium]